MLLAFIISFILIGVMWWNTRNNQKNEMAVQQTNAPAVTPQTAQTPVQQSLPTAPDAVKFVTSGEGKDYSISYDGEISLVINSKGAVINELNIDGEWNRYSNSVSLLSTNRAYQNGDLAFGDTEKLLLYKARPLYTVQSQTSNSIVLAARVNLKGKAVELKRTFTLSSNYQINEEISFRNLTGQTMNMDLDGKSFSVGTLFELVPFDEASPRNRIETQYYVNGKKEKALNIGLVDRIKGKKVGDSLIAGPKWMVLYDNYFMAAMIPLGSNWDGKFKEVSTAKKGQYRQISMSVEQKPFVLESGETKSFAIKYFVGPRKENIAKAVDDSLKVVFRWGSLFNWLMKPIEWAINGGIFLLGKVIKSWGLVIILMALVIKLLLSPLSIKAAISIKRMNMLQPKLKNLQEKYKDDQQKLQAKTMELYKKEKVNPLGGCLPMILQIPVFFALYRVLSTSVELRGAAFMWIKDLTQPDTLFMIGTFHFNLLPLLMTGIQLVQTKLQSTTNATMAQQSKLQTYMLPVMFLFLFWNMPAGLVLYWTIQNVYTIIEQYIINKDKYVKLI